MYDIRTQQYDGTSGEKVLWDSDKEKWKEIVHEVLFCVFKNPADPLPEGQKFL